MAAIKLLISTHQGVIYDEMVDYVVIMDKKSEFAIMKDHVDLISSGEEGFVKLVRDNNQFYVAITDYALMVTQNKISVICAEAIIGNTKERAHELLLEARHERLEMNRKINTELEITERELRDNIKQIKAGEL